MCGITGVLAFTEKGKEEFKKVPDALSKMRFRGPDANRFIQNGNACLGHARLSIIDISEAANQPFTDSSGRYIIVFNGEIFNYRELAETLKGKGIQLRTSSDTEVLLNLFILQGEKCLAQLNGFFAFAVYDRQTSNLFIARDRYGIKPLHFVCTEDYFCFASEAKALYCYTFPRNINYDAVFDYFHLNYFRPDQSIYKAVQKLEPGCFIRSVKPQMVVEKYYDILPGADPIISNTSHKYDESCKELHRLLSNSVKRRLISDVPLGCFLSGGIDSSIVTALAAQHAGKIKTFSIGFKEEKHFDETNFAQMVADKWKTDHTVFYVGNNDLLEEVYHVLDYLDEPFADSSALNVYILSKLTRKHVTVALSGDGADEIFGGYHKQEADLRLRLNPSYKWVSSILKPITSIIPPSRNSRFGNLSRQIEKLNRGAGLTPSERYWEWAGFYAGGDSSGLFTSSFLEKVTPKSYSLNSYTSIISAGKYRFNDYLLADTKLVLPGDMLTKVDSMSMANSLEVRVPFLDFTVVNYAFSLPSEFKILPGNRKRILKDAFKNELPDEIYRRGKKGFEVPLLNWLRKDLNATIDKYLMDKKFIENQGVFNFESLNKLKKELHSNQPGDSVAKIWALLVFQHWYNKYHLNA